MPLALNDVDLESQIGPTAHVARQSEQRFHTTASRGTFRALLTSSKRRVQSAKFHLLQVNRSRMSRLKETVTIRSHPNRATVKLSLGSPMDYRPHACAAVLKAVSREET